MLYHLIQSQSRRNSMLNQTTLNWPGLLSLNDKSQCGSPNYFFCDLVQGNSTHSPWWRDSHGAHICIPAVAIVGKNPPSDSFTCFYQRHLYVIIIIVNNLTIINILRVAIIAKKSQICGKILYPQVTGDLNATENGHRGVFCPKKVHSFVTFFSQ